MKKIILAFVFGIVVISALLFITIRFNPNGCNSLTAIKKVDSLYIQKESVKSFVLPDDITLENKYTYSCYQDFGNRDSYTINTVLKYKDQLVQSWKYLSRKDEWLSLFEKQIYDFDVMKGSDVLKINLKKSTTISSEYFSNQSNRNIDLKFYFSVEKQNWLDIDYAN